jgi:hypothetical protein
LILFSHISKAITPRIRGQAWGRVQWEPSLTIEEFREHFRDLDYGTEAQSEGRCSHILGPTIIVSGVKQGDGG